MAPSELDYNSLSRSLLDYRRSQRQKRFAAKTHTIDSNSEIELEEQVAAAMLAVRAYGLRLPRLPETIAIPISKVAYKRFRQKLSSKHQQQQTPDIAFQHRGNTLTITMPSDEHSQLVTDFRETLLGRLRTLTARNMVLKVTQKSTSVQIYEKSDIVVCIRSDGNVPLQSKTSAKRGTYKVVPDLALYMTNGPKKDVNPYPTFVLEIAVSQPLRARQQNERHIGLIPKLMAYIVEANGNIRCSAGIKVDYRAGAVQTPETFAAVYTFAELEDGTFGAVGECVKIIDKEGNLCREGGEGAIELKLQDMLFGFDGELASSIDMTSVLCIKDSAIRDWVLESMKKGTPDGVDATNGYEILKRPTGYSAVQLVEVNGGDNSDNSQESDETNATSNGSRYDESSEAGYSSDDHIDPDHNVNLAEEDLE